MAFLIPFAPLILAGAGVIGAAATLAGALGGPKAPQLPVTTGAQAAVGLTGEAGRRARALGGGGPSTILTGPQGLLEQTPTTKKTLLGA